MSDPIALARPVREPLDNESWDDVPWVVDFYDGRRRYRSSSVPMEPDIARHHAKRFAKESAMEAAKRRARDARLAALRAARQT